MAVAEDTGGLPNLGNTCYLNAVIQAVSANSTLRESMRAHPLVCPTLVEADLRPDTLRGLAKELGYKNISKQEDAHECFTRWVQFAGKSVPAVTHLLTSTFRNQSFCGACKLASTHEQEEQGAITLHLPNAGAKTRKNQRWTLPFLFNETQSAGAADFAFTCEACQRNGSKKDLPAEKTNTLIEAPAVLVLYVKRFFQPRRGGWRLKLRDELEFERNFLAAGSNFRLRAMVVHEGSSPYNGHYVTYTQNGNAPDEWTKRSDEQSKYCNWAEVYFKASRDVCLFFFERVEPEVNSPRQGSETPGDLESDPNRTPPPRTSQRLANPGVSPSPKPLPFVSPFKGAKKARRQLDHGSFQSDKGSEAEEFPIGTESESEERSWWEGNGDNSDTGDHSDVTPPPSKDSHHDSDSSASPGDSPVSTLVGFDSKPVGNSSASLPTHGPVSDECRVEPADSPIENPGSGGVSTLPSISPCSPKDKNPDSASGPSPVSTSPASPEYSAPTSLVSPEYSAPSSPASPEYSAPTPGGEQGEIDGSPSETPASAAPQKAKPKRAKRSKIRRLPVPGKFTLSELKERVAEAGVSSQWTQSCRKNQTEPHHASCILAGSRDKDKSTGCVSAVWEGSGYVTVQGPAALAAEWVRRLSTPSSAVAPEIGLACFDNVELSQIAESHRCPSWKNIPPALRPAVRDVYRPLLKQARAECSDPSSPEALEKQRATKCIAMLGCLLFRAPVHDPRFTRAHGRKESSKVPQIRARLGQANRGEWATLLSNALLFLERNAVRRLESAAKSPKDAPAPPDQFEKAHRFCGVASLGAPARARRMLDSAGILPVDEASSQLLRDVILEHPYLVEGLEPGEEGEEGEGSDVGQAQVGSGSASEDPIAQQQPDPQCHKNLPKLKIDRPTDAAIKEAVRSAPKGTGAGRLGDRIEFWQILVASEDTSDEAVGFIGDLCEGKACECWYNFFSVVGLTALRKPNKPRPRPIGSPEPLYRLAARSWLKVTGAKAAEYLGPWQLAIGTGAGCEVYANSARFFAMQDPSLVWDKHDVANAFGEIDRKAMLAEASSFCTGLGNFASRMYGSNTATKYVGQAQNGASVLLLARRGVVQGDPLGPLLFCLGVQPSLARADCAMHAALGETTASPRPPSFPTPPHWEAEIEAWIGNAQSVCKKERSDTAGSVFHRITFMDDIATGAPSYLALLIPQLLSLVLRVVGLRLDVSQHASYCPGSAGADDGLVLVGAPFGSFAAFCAESELPQSLAAIGGVQFLQNFNSKVIDKWAEGVKVLAKVPEFAEGWPSAHLAFQALQLSAQLRLSYHCRIAPLTPDTAAHVRSVLWSAGSSIAGLPSDLHPDHTARLQADLPILDGGLGFRKVETIAPAAYLAAWLDAVPHISRMSGHVSVSDFIAAVDNKTVGNGGSLLAEAVRLAATAGVPHCKENGHLKGLFRARDSLLDSASKSDVSKFLRKNGTFKWQKFLCSELTERAIAEFRIRATDVQEKHRQRASEPGAGSHSWLLAQPRGDLTEPYLENDLFRSSIRARLFLPEPNVPKDAKCRHVRSRQGSKGQEAGTLCGAPLCPFLHHSCWCFIGGLVTARHDFVAEGLAHDLNAVGLRCEHEVWEPRWDRDKVQKDGQVETLHARLDLRVHEPLSGQVTYLDVRVFHPVSSKGKISDWCRPEKHELQKHKRYPTQGPNGERLHPFRFSPLVFNDLGGLSREGWKRLQSLVAVAPRRKHSEASAGSIVQAAALRVVRLTALLKRESLTGVGRGAAKAREGEPGLGVEVMSNPDSDGEIEVAPQDSQESPSQEGRQAESFAEPSVPFSGLAPARPAAISRDFSEVRGRVRNAIAHSALFQAAAQNAGGPGSALRWNQLPGANAGWVSHVSRPSAE